MQPVVEFGLTDSCCSLAWFRSGATVAAGMNGKVPQGKNILSRYKKYLCVQVVRLHDTRHGGGKPSQATNTRATNGVTVDPSSDFRIAGHGDNQVRTNQSSVLSNYY